MVKVNFCPARVSSNVMNIEAKITLTSIFASDVDRAPCLFDVILTPKSSVPPYPLVRTPPSRSVSGNVSLKYIFAVWVIVIECKLSRDILFIHQIRACFE